MHRRAFLVSAGGTLAALTGCLGRRQTDGPPPTSPSDDPSSTTTTDSTADVTVDSLHLQYGVVTPTSPDSIGVTNPETAYLVASVRVEGSLPWQAFGLRMDDVRYSPTRLDRLYRTSWGDDHWYGAERTEGLVLFEAPAAVTADLRLTWPGGERRVDEGIVARLSASAPQLSATLDAPTTHDDATAPPVYVEVTNEGSTPGRFLGALNRTGPLVAYTPVARLSELVPAGETTTLSVPDSWSGRPDGERIGDDAPDVTYRLQFVGGDASAEIRLVDGA